MREGLGTLLSKILVKDLKLSFFSMNVDECFSNSNQKVFSVLVSYYSESQGEVVIRHFKSKTLTVVNADVILNFVLGTFEANGIPLTQLISNLSDSAGRI
jgi:hypothetical protein